MVLTLLGSIVLVLIINNEAISACTFLKVEGSYMWVSTVLGAIFLVFMGVNKASPACKFIYVSSGFYCSCEEHRPIDSFCSDNNFI